MVAAVGLLVVIVGVGQLLGVFFIRPVGADVDQCGNVADVCVLRRLAAAVQGSDGQLNAAAADLGGERLFIEVAEVLHADLFQRDQYVAEGAIQQLDGGGFRCWHQA